MTDTDSCPSCGSEDVLIGNFVLSCCSCGWHYLNAHPCSVCGKPSYSCVGINSRVLYGCREHGASSQIGKVWA